MDLFRNAVSGFDAYTAKKPEQKSDKPALPGERRDKFQPSSTTSSSSTSTSSSATSTPKIETYRTVPNKDPFAELEKEEREKAEKLKQETLKNKDLPTDPNQPKLLRKKTKPGAAPSIPTPSPSTPDPSNGTKRPSSATTTKQHSPASQATFAVTEKKVQDMLAELDQLRKHNAQLSELNSMLGHENDNLVKRTARGASIPRSNSTTWQSMDDEEATPTHTTPTPTSTVSLPSSSSSHNIHPSQHIHVPLSHRSHISTSGSHHSISSLLNDNNIQHADVDVLKLTQQLEQAEKRIQELLIDSKVSHQTIEKMRQVADDIDQVHNSSFQALQADFNEMERKCWEKERVVNEQQARIAELQDTLAKTRASAEDKLSLFNLEVEREIVRSKGEKERIKLTQQLKEQELSYQKLKKLYDQLKITKGIPAGYVANGIEESVFLKEKEDKENMIKRWEDAQKKLEDHQKRERKLSDTVEQLRSEKSSLEKQLKSITPTSFTSSTPSPDVAALQSTITSLQSQLKAATEHIPSTTTTTIQSDPALQQQFQELQTSHQNLEQKYQTTSTELTSSLATITSLRSEISSLTSQLDNMKREHALLNTNEQEHEIEIKKQIQELQTQVNTLQQTNITQQSESDTTIRTLREEKSNIQQEMEKLERLDKQQIEELQNKVAQEKENAKIQDGKQQAIISDLTSRNTAHETTITALQSRITSLEQEKSNLQSQIQTLQQEKSDLQSHIQTLQQEKLTFQLKITSIEQEMEELHHELDENHATIQTMKEQEQRQWQQIADLQHSVESKSEEHDLLLKHGLSVQHELEDITHKYEELVKTNEMNETKYKQEHDTWSKEKQQLKQQLQDTTNTWKQEIQTWEQRYTSLETSYEKSKQEWEETTQTWEHEKQTLQGQIESRDADITGLRASIADLDAEKTRLEGVVAQKVAALKIYHDEIKENAAKKKRDSQSTPSATSTPRKPIPKPPAKPLAKLLSSTLKLMHKDDDEDKEEGSNVNMFDTNGNPVDDNVRNELSEEVAVSLSTRLEKLESERTRMHTEMDELRRQLQAEQYIIERMRNGDEEAWRGKNKKAPPATTTTTEIQKLLTQTININKELEIRAKAQDSQIKRLKDLLQVRNDEIKSLTASAHH